jgi:hypothetical protein
MRKSPHGQRDPRDEFDLAMIGILAGECPRMEALEQDENARMAATRAKVSINRLSDDYITGIRRIF